ncbi:WXG100 family type VII secretion target [Nocardioides sp. NPDC006303]|uniref:WXG100 family type VII secretion target n=1 Tax=Nocardioides sp. NPDC006303 TaxID=3156747 RepID=UPI0033B5DEAE
MTVTYDELQSWKPEQLDAAADDLNTARKKLLDQQDEMDAGKVPDTWIGQSATAAENRHRRLVASLNDMAAPLSQVINALDEASASIKKAKDNAEAAYNTAIGRGWKVTFSGASVQISDPTPDEEDPDKDKGMRDDLAEDIARALGDAEAAESSLASVLNSAKKGDYDGGDGSIEEASLPPELRNLSTDELIKKMLEDPGKYDGYTNALSTYEQQQLGEAIANRFGDLTAEDGIGDDGTPPIGDPEAAKLAEMLAAYGDDSTVSTAILNKTGTDGFLNIQKNLLASMQSGGWYMGEDQPYVTGDTMADLQRAWGTTLASATSGTTGDNVAGTSEHVSGDWVQSLVERGDDEYEVAHAMGDTGSPYGFQLLAPMLRDGGHGSYLLNEVGTSMEKMERDAPGGGLIWRTGNGQLDFTQGTWDELSGEDPNYDSGMDPFGALFDGMSQNHEAARDFLSGDLAGAGAVDDSTSRMEYYMKDRIWTALPDGFQPADSHFGNALVSATTHHPTQVSADLAEQAVGVSSEMIDAKGGKHLPESLQVAMGDVVSAYMPDVFISQSDGGLNHMYGHDGLDRPVVAEFDQVQMGQLLSELGTNKDVGEEVFANASAYANLGYNEAFGREGLPVDTRAEQAKSLVNDPFGSVLGSLQKGYGEDLLAEGAASDAEHNAKGDTAWQVGGWIAGQVNDATVGKIPFVGGPISDLTGSAIDSEVQAGTTYNDVDTSSQVRDDIGRSITDRHGTIEALMQEAMYRNIDTDKLPPELVSDGKAVPMSEWTEEQANKWYDYTLTSPEGIAARGVQEDLFDEETLGHSERGQEQGG